MGPFNPKRLQHIPGFSEDGQLQWKRRLLVFSFFLVLSVIIWLLNALSKDYTSEIDYPITYTNFPRHQVLVSELPEHLRLKVNANGYSLLIYKLTNRPVPINFKVSSYAMNRFPSDSSRFYLLTRYAREQISRQLPSELQLVDLAPDSLIFQFANLVEKTVPVIPEVTYALGKEFTVVDQVKIEPDSVTLSGPDLYLDTLAAVHTVPAALGTLEKSYSGSLGIKKDKHFDYDRDKVECTIAIEKVTEFHVNVPIQVIGLPDSMRIQTFPQQVRVSGTVGLSKFKRVVPEAFWVTVNYQEVLENRTQLRVEVQKRPDFLLDLDFYPQTVDYLLTVR